MESKRLHIGVIPDGNRRYQQEMGIQDPEAFASALLDHLRKTLTFPSAHVPVNEVSTFVLTKDNMERSDRTTDMVGIFVEQLWKEWLSELQRTQTAVQFIGDRQCLPEWMRERMARVEEESACEPTSALHIGIAYDAWEDMRGLYDRHFKQSPVDIVVRTGGMKRTSQFFPRHIQGSSLVFLDPYFPRITLSMIQAAVEEHCWRCNSCGRAP